MRRPSSTGDPMATDPRWLRTFPAASGQAALQVVCFPPAGGAAGAFATLIDAADAETSVSVAILPGRETRLAEPAATGLGEVADALAARLVAVGIGERSPYVLLGHSLGGLLAHETARRLERAGMPRPLELVTVASPAPDHPGWTRTRRLPPAELLRRLGGIPPELHEVPQLLDHVVRALADDLAMLAGHHCDDAPVPVPLLVLGDPKDPQLPPGALDGWSRFTTAGCEFERVEGGHFPLGAEELCRRLLFRWRSSAAVHR
ncbi:thioesterase II family protein [Kitasatospora griseola]|uniref:thioesterase II family protein n=1 Tax=Kitasatospora griseola TaxID=2064 RepID=UPI0034352515